MTEHDVFALATRDHQRHLQLIDAVQQEGTEAARLRGVARVAAELRRLARAEHRSLLGALLAVVTARPLAKRAIASQQRLAQLVADLGCSSTEEIDLALSTYRAAFLEHVRFMEEELYPIAHLALGDEHRARLAVVYCDASAEAEALAP